MGFVVALTGFQHDTWFVIPLVQHYQNMYCKPVARVWRSIILYQGLTIRVAGK